MLRCDFPPVCWCLTGYRTTQAGSSDLSTGECVCSVCLPNLWGAAGLCRWDGAVLACSGIAVLPWAPTLLNKPGKMRWIIPWATSPDFPEIKLGFVLEGTPSGSYVQPAMLGWLMKFMKFEFLMGFSTFGGFEIAHGPNCSSFCLWTSQLPLIMCLCFDLFCAQYTLFFPCASPHLSIFWTWAVLFPALVFAQPSRCCETAPWQFPVSHLGISY